MRLDKFLQASGLIPRRARAQEACSRGYVDLNGKQAKPAAAVAIGDRLTVRLSRRASTYEVLALPERPVPKAARNEAARLVETQAIEE